MSSEYLELTIDKFPLDIRKGHDHPVHGPHPREARLFERGSDRALPSQIDELIADPTPSEGEPAAWQSA